MRIATILCTALFVWPLAFTACGDEEEGAEPFATLLACYDEHHNVESLPTLEAIVVCCLEHPIAGVSPSCKDVQADCVAHVTTELGSSVIASDVEAACTEYLKQK